VGIFRLSHVRKIYIHFGALTSGKQGSIVKAIVRDTKANVNVIRGQDIIGEQRTTSLRMIYLNECLLHTFAYEM
jgi:hypothetical protein